MRRARLFHTCIAAAVSIVVASCGGGGGANDQLSASTTYTAAAAAGELVRYTLNTAAGTYSYTITESAYGLTGRQGSGTLTKNSDGTYSPSGFSGRIAVLESGLVLGAIAEDFNNDGTTEVTPFIGASNLVTTAADAAGVYNFISRQCASFDSCANEYGTIKVETSGAWTSCAKGNLSDSTPSCLQSVTGNVGSFESGTAKITLGNSITTAGTMFIFKDVTNRQKALILDLNGQSALGTGAVFAATQELPSSADGRWFYTHSNGYSGYVDVESTNYTDHIVSANQTNSGSFTLNQPWNGFVTTGFGAILMPTGSGLYAGYFPNEGSMSVGLRP
jgi:hypothetical protein